MRARILATAVVFGVGSACQLVAEGRVVDRRTAGDGVTKGWIVEYPSPDPGGSAVAGRLMIARHGRVVRRIEGDSTIWGWAFRHGGREVAYETGPLHGATACVLRDVRDGRVLQRMPGDCRNAGKDALGWVGAVKAR